MRPQPFARSDVVRVAVGHKAGTERIVKSWSARVLSAWRGTDTKGREGWWFSYEPCREDDSVQCMHGHAHWADQPGPWGVQVVAVIGEQTQPWPPLPSWTPQPGNRAYDLVH